MDEERARKMRNKGKMIVTEEDNEEESSSSSCSMISEGEDGMRFEDLNRDCKALIMKHSWPRDVRTMSKVSREFWEIASSDDVWKALLPPNFRGWLARARPALSPKYLSTPAQDIFSDLTFPTHIDDGHKMFWIDEVSGKQSFMLSARAVHFDGSNSNIGWDSPDDASFSKAALISYYPLKLRGKIECNFLSPNTEYTVSCKIRHSNFFQEDPSGRACHSCRSLSAENEEGVISRMLEKGWMEFDIGKFYVGRHGSKSGTIRFSLTAFLRDSFQLDGVKFRPTAIVDQLEANSMSRHLHTSFSFKHSC